MHSWLCAAGYTRLAMKAGNEVERTTCSHETEDVEKQSPTKAFVAVQNRAKQSKNRHMEQNSKAAD